MASVEIIELLSDNADREAHAWIDVHMGDNRLTVRIDPTDDGFRVYMSTNDNVGDEHRVAA